LRVPDFNSILKYRSGYQRPAQWINEVYNIAVSAGLLLLSMPIFILLIIILWFREGRPIFYSGQRLGKDKNIFYMYKFRTLVKNAEQQLEGELLGSRAELITTTGKFLRDTRLDELPQLWNVLKRDMDIAGPRPVRPEVYDNICKNIPHYDRRFAVKPGIIGLSQLFTPHTTPKAIRSMIDNTLLKKKERLAWNLSVLIITCILLLRTIAIRSCRLFCKNIIQQKLLRRYNEKRKLERVTVNKAQAYLLTPENSAQEQYLGQIIDLNSEALLLRSNQDLPHDFRGQLKLQVVVYKILRNGLKSKKALCNCTLYRKKQKGEHETDYVLMYEPISPLNAYLIHQYFLHESVG